MIPPQQRRRLSKRCISGRSALRADNCQQAVYWALPAASTFQSPQQANRPFFPFRHLTFAIRLIGYVWNLRRCLY